MKEEKTKAKKTEANDWILPGNSLDYNEFIQGIQKAEEGPFHSVQESMEHFEQWLKLREKKNKIIPTNKDLIQPITFCLNLIKAGSE